MDDPEARLIAALTGLRAEIDQLAAELKDPVTTESRKQEIKRYLRELFIMLHGLSSS